MVASVVLWFASTLGSYDGNETIVRISPVRGSNATTEPSRWPSCSAATLLQVVAHGEREVADAVLVHEEVAELLERQLRACARPARRCRSSRHPSCPSVKLKKPVMWANRSPSGYSPLVLEPVVRWHRPRDHDAVGRGDAPTGLAEVAEDVAGVVRVVVELGRLEHREPVELHEQHDEAHDQPEPQRRGSAASWTRTCLLASGGVVGDAQEERDQHVVRDERRSAVGDERQGDAREG